MKRQRGRGRKPGGGGHHNQGGHQHPNRAMESNGPEGKVRGPASHIYERYLQMARDAQSSGDWVTAENFLQHAEHYFRLWRQLQPAIPPPVQQDRFTNEPDFETDDEGAQAEAEGGEVEAASGAEGEQPEGEFRQDQRPQQRQNFDAGEDGGFRRRRGRRNRYRPDGERSEGEPRDDSEQRAESADRPERVERQERPERAERPERGDRPERSERPRRERQEASDRQEAEGFSNGPKPAFLGSD